MDFSQHVSQRQVVYFPGQRHILEYCLVLEVSEVMGFSGILIDFYIRKNENCKISLKPRSIPIIYDHMSSFSILVVLNQNLGTKLS